MKLRIAPVYLCSSRTFSLEKIEEVTTFIAGKAQLDAGATRIMLFPIIDEIARYVPTN